MTKYGSTKEPNLKALTEVLDAALKKHVAAFSYFVADLKFKREKPLYLTPEKPYTARTEITVDWFNEPVGIIYALAFAPGDATGDDKTYSLDQLEIPERLKFDETPWKILPRKKDCLAEVMIGFGSVYDDTFYDSIISLEELGVDDVKNPKSIKKLNDLGMSKEHYEMLIGKVDQSFVEGNSPCLDMTVGYTRYGKRFGDPHTIYSNRDLPDAIQLVGFYAVEDEKDPLTDVIDNYGNVPERTDQ